MLSGKNIAGTRDALALLNCLRVPARLNTTEAAVLLGVQEHDIPTLVAAKMLSPLGKPAPNAPKYFAAIDVQECAQDRGWLDQATKALARHWLKKNRGKRATESCASLPTESTEGGRIGHG
jgi:hypothetical protein